jgi:type VI secretion system protein ImpC
MAEAKEAKTEAAAETTEELGLLDQIVEAGRFGTEEAAKERGKDMIKEFVSQVLDETITISPDTEAMLNARIAEIDRLVSLQLNEVMHVPEFQKLESSWRGLKYLLSQSETGEMLKLKILNVGKTELYEEEFGIFGGAPFGALLGDYEFTKSGQDIELLEKVSEVAAAAHAPFVTGASHEMFNLETFTQLDQPRDMAKVFDSTEYAKWKAFRDSEDSRYVALTLPRMLLREPFGSKTVPVESFNYEENVDGSEHDKYLWGNAAWALGARVTEAFAQYGWCATIRGVESGGLVDGLPVHNFKTDEGDVAMKCPTETPITDRREKELADLGFVPLVHCKGTPNAAFFSVQSAQKAKKYQSDAASANARISAQLSKEEIHRFLNNWIMNYVVGNDDAAMSVKAKRPLREARVDVEEIPGKPGAYRAIAFLRPHFQLDELGVAMRLVADLPEPAK